MPAVDEFDALIEQIDQASNEELGFEDPDDPNANDDDLVGEDSYDLELEV